MKLLSVLFVLILSLQSQARVEVLFHPHDPTLEKIAQWITEAHASVDISMYNMDLTDNSPVVQALKTPAIQERLHSGNLHIRMTLELYGSPAENEKKRQQAEALGIDVRYFGRSVKAHHKFAVIDGHRPELARVITGSANWSMSSYQGYNENILFLSQEPEATYRYTVEFKRLWENSKEFGFSSGESLNILPFAADQEDIEIYFNTPRVLTPSSSEESNLTKQIVKRIQSAQSELLIATTRIRLVPVLEALQAAAERGVHIQAVISQDDFRDLGRRAKYFHPNFQLRVKFYNLKVADYMRYQMHNKFMIVDRKEIVTGSFNWSMSSENNHLENLIALSGSKAQEVLGNYLNEFNSIWDLGRTSYSSTLETFKSGANPGCAIPHMSLYPQEIRALLRYSKSCH